MYLAKKDNDDPEQGKAPHRGDKDEGCKGQEKMQQFHHFGKYKT